MTADQLPNIPEYGTGQGLRAVVANALTEQERKAALVGDMTAADPLHVFLTAALAASTANVAAG